MFPVNISTDNLNIFIKRDKKYNKKVSWLDLVIYFRIHGRLICRCPTVLTKERAIKDYKDVLNSFIEHEWTDEEKQETKEWQLCGYKTLKEFKNKKEIMLRHCYDDPESEEIHQDLFSLVPVDKYNHRPYISEIILPCTNITIEYLKLAAQKFLKEHYNIKKDLKEINFINVNTKEELENYKKKMKYEIDLFETMKKSGKKPKLVFSQDAAKDMFGDDVKEVTLDGKKTIVKFEDGEEITTIDPVFKFIKKRKPRKKSKKS